MARMATKMPTQKTIAASITSLIVALIFFVVDPAGDALGAQKDTVYALLLPTISFLVTYFVPPNVRDTIETA